MMKWYSNFRNIKFALIAVAAIIVLTSLVVSNSIVNELKEEETRKIEIWAEAMSTLNNAEYQEVSLEDIQSGKFVLDDSGSHQGDGEDLKFAAAVMNSNTTIPVIVTNQQGNITLHRNIEIPAGTDSLAVIMETLSDMRTEGKIIRMDVGDSNSGEYIEVCYSDSLILKQLSYYPYIQLTVMLLFVLICFVAILASKRAEQNRVWVGLSKETAHQLGTPISSLMAWVEVLKEKYAGDELIPEMERDVTRLQRVAERFSKIGSKPEPTAEDFAEVVGRSVDYVKRRSPSQVEYEVVLPKKPLLVRINAPLVEWVIENLCKNAVDAMDGKGKISIVVSHNDSTAFADVSDTGKGISKACRKRVFEPGYTTKKRGWGLGLSLAKRIIEQYHKGRIFVKSSTPGKGTTFRVQLKK